MRMHKPPEYADQNMHNINASLSKREEIAVAALVALIEKDDGTHTAANLGKRSVELADALLAALHPQLAEDAHAQSPTSNPTHPGR